MNKEDYNIWIEPYICSFHREKPGEDFAGCSCSTGFGMHPKDSKTFCEENKPKSFNALEDLLIDEAS